MRELLRDITAISPLVLVLLAIWLAPDWVKKWLEVRDRWRDGR